MAVVDDVEDALRLLMLDDADVVELIVDRIFTDVLEQGVCLPAVVMSRLSAVDEMKLSDRAKGVNARIQIECYAATRSEARSVVRAIKDADITQTKGLTHGVDIRGIAIEDGSREYVDYPNDASDEHRYVTSFDLKVSYLEE